MNLISKLFQKKKEKEFALNSLQKKLLEHFKRFSGLNDEYIKKHLWRKKGFRYKDEYNFRKPKKSDEIDWYYRTNEKYVFVNFIHTNWKHIEKITSGKILDYGAGSGIDTFYLAQKEGYEIDYFDVSVIQQEFVKFVIEVEKINNISIIKPYYNGKYNTINCIQGEYDGVLFRSLLEHVPYYDTLLEHITKKVKKGGKIYEASRFGKSNKDPMHIEEKKPINKIMSENGFTLDFEDNHHKIWIKK